MRHKKSQSEILGFVVIVVLITIVGVIFLGISLRNKGGIQQDNIEISNFLGAIMKVTSDCVIKEPFYASVEELVKSCRRSESCTDGRTSCEVLEGIYNQTIENIWQVGADRPIKYLKLATYYQLDVSDSSTKQADFLMIEQGDKTECNNRQAGQYPLIVPPGVINQELEICKGS